MIKRITGILSIIFLLHFACSEKENVQTISSEEEKNSELALMMRDMHVYLKHVKDQIAKDSLASIPDFHQSWESLKTATPTDASVRTTEFDKFSDDFTHSVELLISEDNNRIYNYNNVVNNCVSCHKEYCPGPIKAINKLRI